MNAITGTDFLLKALKEAEAEAGGYHFTKGFIGSFVDALKKGSPRYDLPYVIEHLEYFLKALEEQVQIGVG